jgi:hypothetical protein
MNVSGQDTINLPLKIRTGIEVSGPALYFSNKDILNAEGYVSADLNAGTSFLIGGGYLDYSYSQYNYDYRNNGFFFRTGFDFNLMKPKKAQGKYFTGIGIHYGLSSYTSEVVSFNTENYWGPVTSSVGSRSSLAHYAELTPGVRAEIFKNVSIGWSINIRMLISSGSGKDITPLYLPGFGNGAKRVSTGLSYYLTWNIPYKRIRVIQKPPAPEEPEEPVTPQKP